MDRAPLLSELMPWSVAGLRTGRGWVLSPYPEVLVARWQRLAEAPAERRAVLFGPSRSRTVESSVPQLPGQAASSNRLSRDPGPCPQPVQIRHGAFDRLWLLPDQRVLDQPRPELWRVADAAQVFATVQPADADGPGVVCSAELPDGWRGRGVGRIHPLYRRPGGLEPNVAPGLLRRLGRVLGIRVTAEDLLAWITAITAAPEVAPAAVVTAVPGARTGVQAAGGPGVPAGPGARSGEEVSVPVPASAELWREGVGLGRRLVWLQSFGARFGTAPGDRPRMPGGRRPFVRERVGGWPEALAYEAETESLLLGDGRLAPVAAAAWEFRAGGAPVLAEWFERRMPDAEVRPGSLEALGLGDWPQEYTAELVELLTVLSLSAELRPALRELRRGPWLSASDLAAAGVLPVPPWCRRPASVLCREEGPEGQFVLL